MLSCEKVENVVNPPQKPVAANNIWLGFHWVSFWVKPSKKPNRKHPKTFTTKVPQGKELIKLSLIEIR